MQAKSDNRNLATSDVAPCQTLYVRNLPEKIAKKKLRELLHAAFSPYGAVVWVSAEKTLKLRGQAFITFQDLASATAAMRKMHGSEFLDRQIAVTYARSISDKAAPDAPAAKKKRKRDRQHMDDANTLEDGKGGHEPVPSSSAELVVNDDAAMEMSEPEEPLPPNNILFAQNLPEKTTSGAATELADLFSRFAGFVEIRPVPGKRSIAFIEFSSESEAAIALSGLQGHQLGDPPVSISLSFAKK